MQQQHKEQEHHQGPRPPQHVLRKVNRKVQFLESEWLARICTLPYATVVGMGSATGTKAQA